MYILRYHSNDFFYLEVKFPWTFFSHVTGTFFCVIRSNFPFNSIKFMKSTIRCFTRIAQKTFLVTSLDLVMYFSMLTISTQQSINNPSTIYQRGLFFYQFYCNISLPRCSRRWEKNPLFYRLMRMGVFLIKALLAWLTTCFIKTYISLPLHCTCV